jgi:hypothetical protein
VSQNIHSWRIPLDFGIGLPSRMEIIALCKYLEVPAKASDQSEYQVK